MHSPVLPAQAYRRVYAMLLHRHLEDLAGTDAIRLELRTLEDIEAYVAALVEITHDLLCVTCDDPEDFLRGRTLQYAAEEARQAQASERGGRT